MAGRNAQDEALAACLRHAGLDVVFARFDRDSDLAHVEIRTGDQLHHFETSVTADAASACADLRNQIAAYLPAMICAGRLTRLMAGAAKPVRWRVAGVGRVARGLSLRLGVDFAFRRQPVFQRFAVFSSPGFVDFVRSSGNPFEPGGRAGPAIRCRFRRKPVRRASVPFFLFWASGLLRCQLSDRVLIVCAVRAIRQHPIRIVRSTAIRSIRVIHAPRPGFTLEQGWTRRAFPLRDRRRSVCDRMPRCASRRQCLRR